MKSSGTEDWMSFALFNLKEKNSYLWNF